MDKIVAKVFRVLLLGLLTATPVLGRPAQVILLRHAEKPWDDADIHLSDRGEKRARALAGFLTNNPSLTNRGLPTLLFATRPTPKGHGLRPSETLEPLARQLHLPIHTPFPAVDYAALARRVLSSPEFDNQTVVICWVHEYLPELAAALGVKSPPSWKGSEFDRVWLITWKGDKAKLKDLPQRLLPGDSKH